MPFDFGIEFISKRDGPTPKIVADFEWAMLVETLKEPGGLERLQIALQDDEPNDDASQSQDGNADERTPGNAIFTKIIP